MIQTQSQQWNQRNKQNNVNPCLKKILQFLLQCHPKVIIWYGLSESEGSVQWPQLELLCYKFSLKASRAHVVPNSPPPTTFHGCQRGTGATESKLLPRVEWTQASLWGRSWGFRVPQTYIAPPPPIRFSQIDQRRLLSVHPWERGNSSYHPLKYIYTEQAFLS